MGYLTIVKSAEGHTYGIGAVERTPAGDVVYTASGVPKGRLEAIAMPLEPSEGWDDAIGLLVEGIGTPRTLSVRLFWPAPEVIPNSLYRDESGWWWRERRHPYSTMLAPEGSR